MENSIRILEKQIEKLKDVIDILSSKLLNDHKNFKLAVGLEVDKINENDSENEMEIDDNESEDEDCLEPNEKTIKWNEAIKHNQQTVETMSKGLRRRRNQNACFGNMTGNRSKGVN